jgi:hypothetical protein
MPAEKTIDTDIHRAAAVQTHGETWGLLEKADRTPEDDERLIHTAHTSCYHWLHAGTAVHRQRGEWLISRVYATLGLGEAAVRHARRCAEITASSPEGLEDFDHAFALEALARSHAVAGEAELATRYRIQAKEAGEMIKSEDDRVYFLGDLEGGRWS